MPYWVNAANAVVVPSDHEGFGLAALEALACDVPVLATPVGNHPTALEGDRRGRCARRTTRTPGARRWQPHLDAADPRVEGRAQSRAVVGAAHGARVLEAWIEVSGAPLYSPAEAPSDGALSI